MDGTIRIPMAPEELICRALEVAIRQKGVSLQRHTVREAVWLFRLQKKPSVNNYGPLIDQHVKFDILDFEVELTATSNTGLTVLNCKLSSQDRYGLMNTTSAVMAFSEMTGGWIAHYNEVSHDNGDLTMFKISTDCGIKIYD